VYHPGKGGLESIWKCVFHWNRWDDIVSYYTQMELEASLIECSLRWSATEPWSGKHRKDERQEVPFICWYCHGCHADIFGRTDDRTMAAGASVTWTHCSVLFEVT
jgi:hypothetical protein